ncbi:glutamine amidotransferase [candidate division MSBL1 archaeon SCGC-AAA385D11]|uniref:Pyridoxal 5'-phosphate synthase subunit PdxT n=1 Tax=candidate division MSBL1 archaeon SCGC-AAA385D11 TaxID=1698286 RepID=A0A133VP20_9EURY|nr:glutamine amidotransferase [candidate division MSBL1 archaeon SCGC-AAA385D11]
MKIGVIGLQGAISEHILAVELAMEALGVEGEAFWVRKGEDINDLDGLIIPGGESTTIGKLMVESGLFQKVQDRADSGMPVLGTCAGLILLAKEGDEQVRRTGQPLLGLMDMQVIRNAFGRQRESFEVDLKIPVFGENAFRAVFIRAPAVKRVWSDVEILAEYQDRIVATRQENLVAMAFHPELTPDTRAHEYFLKICRE